MMTGTITATTESIRAATSRLAPGQAIFLRLPTDQRALLDRLLRCSVAGDVTTAPAPSLHALSFERW